MKTIEELNALRNEVEALNRKLAELTDEEMEQVTGGTFNPTVPTDDVDPYDPNPEPPEPRPFN